MKVNEIFKSIQGEGAYVGYPVLFIRLSGCTRNCNFCDTKYHVNGKNMTVKQIVNKIKNSGVDRVVWTGGEPMMQEDEICEVIIKTDKYYHQLETNGDLLPEAPGFFEYIAFSPKEEKVANNVYSYCMQLDSNIKWDIKIVTDLEMNKNMINYATMLMPLSTYDDKKDLEINKKVWNYCSENNIKYTPRIHKDVWGAKVGK